MDPTTFAFALKLIDLALMAAEEIPLALAALKDGDAKLRTMLDEGRDPTPAEWAALVQQTDALSARLQAQADPPA